MPAHSDKYHSTHEPQELFDIVSDVEKYPEFLPWVSATRITDRYEDHFIADMVVGFKGITQKYTSRVDTIRGEKLEIDVSLVRGPFKHLKTHWIFEPAESGGTNIMFHLDFKFQSAMFEKMIGFVFEKAVSKMTDAFIKRADNILGKN